MASRERPHPLPAAATEAEPLSERALSILEEVLGLEHPDTARSLNTLALIYLAIGRLAEAAELRARAEANRQRRD